MIGDKTWIYGIIQKDGTFYLPSEFTEFFLNGKKQGYVIVTKGVGWFETSTEAVFLSYILILSIQEFKKLQNSIETFVDITNTQRDSLLRTIIKPSRKCLLRSNGRISIDEALRRSTKLSGDVLISMKGNRIQVLSEEIVEIAKKKASLSFKDLVVRIMKGTTLNLTEKN
jgi:DNA-binding transcriptional regulator/RsmH inhibitor MraZ